MASGKVGRGRSPGVTAWRRSAEWKRIASAYALANLRALAKRPRCGAKAKRTGCPCRQPALANGRCRWHGGKTPAGKQWHQPLFSPGTTPSGTSKLDQKLHDLAQARKRQRRLVAKMTPDQRSAHERWQKSHNPSQSARLAYRQAKTQAREARAALDVIHTPGPELLRIEELIRRLTLEAEALTNAAVSAAQPNDDDDDNTTATNLGIFG